MTTYEANRRLVLFGIPTGNASDAVCVRGILARLLAGGALSLADLQIVRDVFELSGLGNAWSYAFLAAMRLSLKQGNTFLRAGKVAVLLGEGGYLDRLGDEDEPNEAFAKRVADEWSRHAADAERELSSSGTALVVRRDVKARDPKGGAAPESGWFFATVDRSVSAIAARLKELAESDDKDLRELDEGVVKEVVRFRGKEGVEFAMNTEQTKAVRLVARRRFVVVTGGPGTGKTTVVCAMLRALLERGDLTGEDIALVAPTGRAGQRMGEALHNQCAAAIGISDAVRRQIEGLSGQTVHSLLGGFPPNWNYTAKNRLPHRLVVVDESSMMDVNLMHALLDALPDDCRLVLLGDQDQLPSVDAGAVLGDIVSAFGENTVVRLVESKRFTKEFAACAQSINKGDLAQFRSSTKALPAPGEVWTDTLAKTDKDNINRVFRYEMNESADPAALQRRVLEWARHYGLLHSTGSTGEVVRGSLVEMAAGIPADDPAFVDGTCSTAVRELFAELDRSRILTVVREGAYGAAGVNELIAKARFGGRMPANPLVKPGIPVLVTRNTRERNLFNGDIGITVKGPSGMVVLFPRGDKVVACPAGLLPEHGLAYAITIHKSQGSEFNNVLVVLPQETDNPLLSRPLVYTGVTRAKERAVVMGSQAVVAKALERSLERDSGCD